MKITVALVLIAIVVYRLRRKPDPTWLPNVDWNGWD